MSRPRFLADEDLRFAIVLAVRRREPAIDFITVHEAAMSEANDADILDQAYRQGMVMVSHDVNTMRAEAEQRVQNAQGLAGLVLTSQRASIRDVAESLVTIWTASEAEEWRDRIMFIPF